MKKSTKIVKRLLALFLVVLMSIDSFAAVVSDNDGSAFITKAEFDSLKNNFQSQIDQYNTSIDSKIDGAIASYLAGAKNQKTTIKPVLVSNYNQMRWINKFMLYGEMKYWSGLDVYSQLSEGWMRPHLDEARVNVRADNIRFFDIMDLGTGLTSLGMRIEPSNSTGGVTWQRSAYVAMAGRSQTPPVLVLDLQKRNGDWVITNETTLSNEFCMGYTAFGLPKLGQKISGTRDAWWFNSQPRYFMTDTNTIELQSTGQDEILVYDIYLAASRTASTDANVSKYRFRCNSDNTRFPIAFATSNCFEDHGYAITQRAISPDARFQFGVADALAAGVTWHKLTNDIQYNSIRNMMFGVDDDIKANLANRLGYAGEGTYFDLSESSAFGSFTGKIFEFNIDDFQKSRSNDANYVQWQTGLNIPVTLRVPLWPQKEIRNIPNANFEFNENYLKVGQGLPLVADIDDSGYLRITFDYDVKYILDEQSKNKQILISIKKEDFNTDNNKYCSGYLDLVDPATTTQTIYTLNSKTFENIDGKVKLTVPVEKGDNLWLRIAPQNSNGGYYAVLDNLKITYISE